MAPPDYPGRQWSRPGDLQKRPPRRQNQRRASSNCSWPCLAPIDIPPLHCMHKKHTKQEKKGDYGINGGLRREWPESGKSARVADYLWRDVGCVLRTVFVLACNHCWCVRRTLDYFLSFSPIEFLHFYAII